MTGYRAHGRIGQSLARRSRLSIDRIVAIHHQIAGNDCQTHAVGQVEFVRLSDIGDDSFVDHDIEFPRIFGIPLHIRHGQQAERFLGLGRWRGYEVVYIALRATGFYLVEVLSVGSQLSELDGVHPAFAHTAFALALGFEFQEVRLGPPHDIRLVAG